MLAALAKDWDGPIIYLTSAVRRAYNVSEQMAIWLGDGDRLHRFAEPSALFYDRAPWDAIVIRNRIETLSAMADESASGRSIVVASARALMQLTLPPQCFRNYSMDLAVGQRHKMEELILRWVGMGYEPDTVVIEPGSFSRRGGILDIYPLASEYPLRIEFFDDEIDSLRHFEPADQRSVERIKAARIVPAREALPQLTPPIAAQFSEWANSITNDAADFSHISADIESLQQGSGFPCLEHYLSYLYGEPASLLDYAPENCLIVLEDADALEATIGDIRDKAEENRKDALSSSRIAMNHPAPMLAWDAFSGQLASMPTIALSSTTGGGAPAPFEPGERYGGQLRTMLNRVRQHRHRGDRVVIITEQVERLENLWYEQDASAQLPAVDTILEAPPSGSLAFRSRFGGGRFRAGESYGETAFHHRCGDLRLVAPGAAPAGVKPAANAAAEHRKRHTPIGRQAPMWCTSITESAGLSACAIAPCTATGANICWWNITARIRYTCRSTKPIASPAMWAPMKRRRPLNKLGKSEQWIKAREKAQRNAEEEAKELLEIYSRRALAIGHGFSPDSAWQHEMEAGFPFIETGRSGAGHPRSERGYAQPEADGPIGLWRCWLWQDRGRPARGVQGGCKMAYRWRFSCQLRY